MARKRKVRHELVVKFAQSHREMTHTEIGNHFRLSRRHVSAILQAEGVECGGHPGRPPKCHGKTDQQAYWEQMLHKAGLGMDSGMRIDGQRIFYGFDNLKEVLANESATSDTAG